MKQTTIPCSEELKNELNKLKYYYGDKTLEETIKRHIHFISLENKNGNNKQNKNPVEENQNEKIS